MFSKIKELDNKVLNNISRMHCPSLNLIMKTASRSANVGIIWWLICLPFLIRSEWRMTGFNFVVALAFAHVMGEGLIKHVVKRIRPCHSLDDDEQIINRPRFYSFPSGHTTASFAMVGVAILRCRPITFVPIILLAALISFSRVYLRVHYLTDVLAGVVLGTTCGMLSVFFFRAVGLA
ncbi:MAG: phosphatase PAP2 family protein [Ruminococcus sp.]|nr:phosphatase PAP2 family protein [Ruminococcus sp.]